MSGLFVQEQVHSVDGLRADRHVRAGACAQGEHANRIWNLIYSQSCFTNITDSCTERRIFHRLISGAPGSDSGCCAGPMCHQQCLHTQCGWLSYAGAAALCKTSLLQEASSWLAARPLGCCSAQLHRQHCIAKGSLGCYPRRSALALLPLRLNRRAWDRAGMHASISAHIAREYLLDEAAGRWGANLPLFAERLGNEGRKAHVENLYFTYLFVLRAVRKAGPLLERAAFETGVPDADARTQALVAQLVRRRARLLPRRHPFGLLQEDPRGKALRHSRTVVLLDDAGRPLRLCELSVRGSACALDSCRGGCPVPSGGQPGRLLWPCLRARGSALWPTCQRHGTTSSCHPQLLRYVADRGRGRRRQVNSEALQQACPVPFDEGRMWKGADSAELKAQLQLHFQNITKVMDCVGCEKCKLWGKLQMLGARCSLPTLTRAVCPQAGSTMGLSHARFVLVRYCQSVPRQCVGMSLARMTTAATVAALLSRFTFRLADEVRARRACTAGRVRVRVR